jgi:hypothetical protein
MGKETTKSSKEDKMRAMDEVENYHRLLSRDIRSIIFLRTVDGVHEFEVQWTDIQLQKTKPTLRVEDGTKVE